MVMEVTNSSDAEVEDDVDVDSDAEFSDDDEEEVELSSADDDSGEEGADVDADGGSGEGESSGNDEDQDDDVNVEEEVVEDEQGQSSESDEQEDDDGDDNDEEEEDDEQDEDKADPGPRDEEDEDDDKSEGEDEDKVEVEEKPQEISGWADSIAKILKSTKPKNKKELMLSRARKDYEVNQAVAARKKVIGGKGKAVDDDLEIIPLDKPKVEGGDDEADTAKKDAKAAASKKKDDKLLSLKVQRKLELKQKKLELAWENLARLQAEKTDPQLERDLVKMATKGVVQLFNAISMQQRTIKTKLRNSEKSEFKKDKVLHQTKDIFDNAMSKSKRLGNSNSSTDSASVEVKKEEVSTSEDEVDVDSDDNDDDVDDDIAEIGRPTATVSIKLNKRKATTPISAKNSPLSKRKPVWNALQDDFMLDAKLKDWDKDSDDSN